MIEINTVYYYRGWITSLNQYAYSWGTEEPTHMVVGGESYPVSSGSVVVEDTISEDYIKAEVVEENISTGGHYRCTGFEVSSTQSGWSYVDVTWPHPVSILSADYVMGVQHIGDTIRVEVTPNTAIGVVTSGFISGTQQFQVQQSVIDNTNVGYLLHLSDNYTASGYLGLSVSEYQGEDESFNNVGYVTDVDEDNLLITTQYPVNRNFNGASPTYVIQTVVMVDDIKISVPGRQQLGESKIGGSYLPAGYKMRLLYYNVDGQEKNFTGVIEYLY